MVDLTENSLHTLKERYLRKDSDGNVIETPEQLFKRVSSSICDTSELEKRMFNHLCNLDFLPNSPTLMNAGTDMSQLSACFTIEIKDNLTSIFDGVKHTVLIFQTGGGVGATFEHIRPKGSHVKSTQGVASGPISFMSNYNVATETIKQGGRRRGAFMALLKDSHPDILEFIECKDKGNTLSNMNISVSITDKFMKCVEDDLDWNLEFDRKIYKTVKARDIFNKIVEHAHYCGDPGVVFIDTINKDNRGEWISQVNPCVTKDTWIMTTEGAKQVNDLIIEKGYGNFNPIINGYSRNSLFGNLYLSKGFFSTGIKDVYRIKTFEGYEIRLTSEHLIVTLEDNDKFHTHLKRVSDLKINDYLDINNHKNINKWEGKYNEREGYLIGSLIGDGHISSDGTIYLSTWGEYDGIKNVRNIIEKYSKEFPTRSDFKGWIHIKRENENDINRHYTMKCHFLNEICVMLGLKYGNEINKVVTPHIEKTSSNFYKGFIKGFFDTDGTVNVNLEKGSSIRLSQSNFESLQSVQRMLLRIGIYSTIYKNRNTESKTMMPDGKGGYKEYNRKDLHELVIANNNIKLFYDKIGFNDTNKMNKVKEILDNYKRNMNEQIYSAKIIEIVKEEAEDVYDCKIEDIHMFDGNGFILHNCSEQPLLPYESCNLGSIRISNFVRYMNGSVLTLIDWDMLKKCVYDAVEFLDLVIDNNNFSETIMKEIPQLKERTLETRKIGLGIMGWADALILLNIQYNSEEACHLAEDLMKFIHEHALEKSVELAKIKGAFPKFDEYYPDNGKHGNKYYMPMRNANLTTIAPTGTISVIANCSSGIEPVYSIVYKRNLKNTIGKDLYEINSLFLKIAKERNFYSEDLIKKISNNHGSVQNITEVPEDVRKLFVTAHDISYKEHIKMQASFQKHTQSGISKTINLPNNATIDDVYNSYILAWKLGCKGVTVYRDGSKEHQVFTIENKKIELQNEAKDIDDLEPRPEILPALVFIKRTGCSTLFITPTKMWDKDAALEGFLNKSTERGGCLGLQDGIAITLSVYNRYLEAINHQHAKNALRIVTHHLMKKTCRPSELAIERQNQKISRGEKIKRKIDSLSCPNAIAQCFQYMLDHNIQVLVDGKIPDFKNNVINDELNTEILESIKTVKVEEVKSDNYKKCPECGNKTIRQEGCMNDTCVVCGWGGCL